MAQRQAMAEHVPSIPASCPDEATQGTDGPQVRSVCVVGAGLAGLACALGAAQAGARVQVLEAHPHPLSIAAHVNVVPGMLRGLAALGLADAVVRRGFPYRATHVVDADGRQRFSLTGRKLAGERYPAMLGIAHDELMAVLLAAVREAGVTLRLGCRPASPVQDPASDLVVLATGAGAADLHALFPHAPAVAGVGQVWWRAVVPRPPALVDALLAMGHEGDKAGAIPMNMRQAGLYLLHRDDGQPLPAAKERAARLRAALSRYRGLLRDMAALLDDASPVLVQPVRHACMAVPWHRDRFLAAGDTAHLLTPQFGQNGAQAIDDAVVLKDLLRQRVAREQLPAEFTRRRASRVQAVHDICLQAARWDLRPGADTDLQALWTHLGQLSASEP